MILLGVVLDLLLYNSKIGVSREHFAESGVLGVLTHVCTIDSGLGSNDGLVDEVVSEDSVHFNFLSWLLAFSDRSQPLFVLRCFPLFFMYLL